MYARAHSVALGQVDCGRRRHRRVPQVHRLPEPCWQAIRQGDGGPLGRNRGAGSRVRWGCAAEGRGVGTGTDRRHCRPLHVHDPAGVPLFWCDVQRRLLGAVGSVSSTPCYHDVREPNAASAPTGSPMGRRWTHENATSVTPGGRCGCKPRSRGAIRTRSPALVRTGEARGNAGTFGLPARHDRRNLDRSEPVIGYGPHGEACTATTRHPEVPANDTSLLLAGAVTSICRMILALVHCAIEDAGGTVAHVATDSVAVPASRDGGLWPCPGGPHRMPDGREAIRLLTFDQLRTIMARFDALLGHRNRPAWKEECGSLTLPTMGVVLGVNKVVLGRPDQNGIWELVRSTDADLGGHLIDPTGSGRRTEDGRWWWAADLERHLLAAAIETDHSRAIAVPNNLPSWADRLSLRAERASTWSELRHLRKATGDPAVMPFARYMRAETGGKDGGPVALGHHLDPEAWPGIDFRLGGAPVALVVPGPEGEPRHVAGDGQALRRVAVRTVADHLSRWLREVDPSMVGPRRGLRTAEPVHTNPALVHVVGRSGALFDGTDGAALVFGSTSGSDELREEAQAIGQRRSPGGPISRFGPSNATSPGSAHRRASRPPSSPQRSSVSENGTASGARSPSSAARTGAGARTPAGWLTTAKSSGQPIGQQRLTTGSTRRRRPCSTVSRGWIRWAPLCSPLHRGCAQLSRPPSPQVGRLRIWPVRWRPLDRCGRHVPRWVPS